MEKVESRNSKIIQEQFLRLDIDLTKIQQISPGRMMRWQFAQILESFVVGSQ